MDHTVSLDSQPGSLRYWKFLNLYEAKPWQQYLSFLSSKLDQLQRTGATAETLAEEDPVGVLAVLGVLCVPISQTVDQEVDDLDALTHQAQQKFSIALLEDSAILEEPTIAAEAYARWATAAVAETTGHRVFDFDALFQRAHMFPSSPSCSTASEASSACSAVTAHLHSAATASP